VKANSEKDNAEETYGNIDRKKFIKRQEALGNVVLSPEDNELLIDCDTEEQFRNFLELFEILNTNLLFYPKPPDAYYDEVKLWESKSGAEHYHILIFLPFTVTSVERIAYQAALGSDPKRELLSLIRMKHGDDFPSILIEKPGFVKPKLERTI
jgi:hypothetical protein